MDLALNGDLSELDNADDQSVFARHTFVSYRLMVRLSIALA